MNYDDVEKSNILLVLQLLNGIRSHTCGTLQLVLVLLLYQDVSSVFYSQVIFICILKYIFFIYT